MSEIYIPTSITLGDTDLPFTRLFEEFAATDEGQDLAKRTRFDAYKNETKASNKEWEELGPDVNNLHHMPFTVGILEQQIVMNETPHPEWKGGVSPRALLTPDEKVDITFTAWTHDNAEAITGDTQYHNKTKEHHRIEMLVYRGLAHDNWRKYASGVEVDQLVDRVEAILSDTTSKLGAIFNTIERTGYVGTGLKALDLSKVKSGDLAEQLQLMGVRVPLFHLPHLVNAADIYPATHEFLLQQQDAIDRSFHTARDEQLELKGITVDEAAESWYGKFLPSLAA